MAYGPQQKDLISHWNASEKAYEKTAQAKNPPKKVAKPKVTKVVDQRHIDAVGRRKAKLHANAMVRYNAAHPSIPTAPKAQSEDALLQAAIRLKFGGAEQAYNDQLNQNTRFNSGTGDWYANALKEINGLKAQGQQQSQETLGRIQNYNSTPTIQNANEQLAADARNNLNSQYGAMVGRDANANAAAMDRVQAAFLTQQGNTRNQTNTDRQRILQAQAGLAGQKGDYALTYGAQQAAAQSKAANDQAKLDLAAKALGLKRDTYTNVQVPLATSLIGDRKAGQRVARTKTRQTKNQDAVSNALKVNDLALKAYKLAHPNAGKGGGSNATYSKSKVQGFRANWDYANATAKQLKDKKTYTDKAGKAKPVTHDVTYSALLAATKDPDIAKAAALAAFGKQIPADLRHRLAIKGVHPPKIKKKQSLGEVILGAGQKLLNP